jgi:hypothetical protein
MRKKKTFSIFSTFLKWRLCVATAAKKEEGGGGSTSMFAGAAGGVVAIAGSGIAVVMKLCKKWEFSISVGSQIPVITLVITLHKHWLNQRKDACWSLTVQTPLAHILGREQHFEVLTRTHSAIMRPPFVCLYRHVRSMSNSTNYVVWYRENMTQFVQSKIILQIVKEVSWRNFFRTIVSEVMRLFTMTKQKSECVLFTIHNTAECDLLT